MTTIRFERVLRDCLHNTSGGRPSIYDFNVMIDGEHRATFRKWHTGVGHDLRTVDDGELIDGYRYGLFFKGDFPDVAAKNLQDGKIPTMAQYAERAEKRRVKAMQEDAERAAACQAYMIKEAAEDMLAACEDALAYVNQESGCIDGRRLAHRLHDVIAKARGRL